MSTDRLSQPNKLLQDVADLVAFAMDPSLSQRLKKLHVNWSTGSVTDADEVIRELLERRSWVRYKEGDLLLTDDGLAFLSKFLINFEAQFPKGTEVCEKYVVEEILASGKNSIALKARNKLIGREVVLKFFRPGRGAAIISNLPTVGKAGGEPVLVHPIDLLSCRIKAKDDTQLAISGLVFPFIAGESLENFLSSQRPLSPYVIQSYIEQVAHALACLENSDMQHGDLHSNNILVCVDANNAVQFRIIDVSFGAVSASEYEYPYDDFLYFKEHLIKAIWCLQRNTKRLSIQKHLGARLYSLVEFIINSPKLRFDEVLKLLRTSSPFEAYKERQKAFIASKFSRPRVLGLLRYEEIVDPAQAVSLFVPFQELFDEISQFGSSVLFGHRGSGKSTYLASMAFFPSVKDPIFDFRKKFGVFFACRQGEFKQFKADLVDYGATTYLLLKHIVILKIIRRIISLLSSATALGKIREAPDYSAVSEFLTPYVLQGATLNFPTTNVTILENLHAALLRNEVAEIDVLFGNQHEKPPAKLLTEDKLIQFVEMVRGVIPELHSTQFYFLFDDAGEPNLPVQVQMVLNDILRSVNPNYCVKLSAERFSYTFQAADGKILEDTHDYVTYNISETLSLGSGRSPERKEIKQYFESLVAKRLSDSGYGSSKISDYLGEELYSIDDLVSKLADPKNRSARYCGWNMVWQLADRTSRHLLELITTIFASGDVRENAPPFVISPYIQNKAIRAFSENKLKSLNFIPGAIDVEWQAVGLGKQLYEFAAAFGKYSYLSLKRPPMKTKKRKRRYHEKLAIEIDGEVVLGDEAKNILKQLIRYAVIDDSKIVKAFDDQTKKPIYILNRIFCPALGISFRRDSHWRLSTRRFEKLLLHPRSYVRDSRRLLNSDAPDESESQQALF